MPKQFTTQLPFEGFYESTIDSFIDDEINGFFGDSDIPEKWYDHFTINETMQDSICKEYVISFVDWIERETGIVIESLEFVESTSPKFYNYETDKIYCTLSDSDIRKLWRNTSKDSLVKTIKERHESRPGFISFYDSDIESETWQKSPSQYDENQLMTLILAFMDTQGIQLDSWDIWESARSNGVLSNIIFDNLPDECRVMIEQYEESKNG